ncbi:hypothetical protein [Pseudoalteromonas sp. Of7M-16]|uniref:hypothetical protein n=1 Tax=Pseudoalteromonas sp. Of7M-16 TaxID=2917756 RepID=UPI001EF64F8A|nr:hypothetical protein [Pseudoalteromonas sp. Of7M-16]MCG7550468.1 hypothetical protein [Pseudoalteromonas sp. Of7M-16]
MSNNPLQGRASPSDNSSASPISAVRQIAKGASSGQLLGEQLLIRYGKANNIEKPTQITQQQMLDTFVVTGLDFVGQASHGYGAKGVGVGIDFGVDIGKAVLPGFATADAKVSVKASGASEVLVALTRQPCVRDVHPICLMTAKGELWEMELGIGASIGLKASTSIDTSGQSSNMMTSKEEKETQKQQAQQQFGTYGTMALEQIGLEASANIGAEANAKYHGELMMLRDPYPSWYNSVRDPSLEEIFFDLVDYGSKTGSKSRIKQFFDRESKTIGPLFKDLSFWQTIQKAITGGNIPFEQLLLSLSDASAWLLHIQAINDRGDKQEIITTLDDLAQQIATQQEKNWIVRRFNKTEKREMKMTALQYFEQQGFNLLLPSKGLSGFASLNDWENAITWVKQALSLDPSKLNELLTEVIHHQKVVAYFQNKSDKSPPPAPDYALRRNRLSFVNLWGHAASAGAGAKMALAGKATPALSLATTAGVSVNGEKKWTSYRLQQFEIAPTDNEEQICERIFTQDSSITYSQAAITGEAALKISLAGLDPVKKVSGKKAETTKDKVLVNTLGYQSAQFTWQPVLKAEEVTLEKGTGLTYGYSITVANLEKIIANEPGSDKLLNTLADLLHVSTTDLMTAITAGQWITQSKLPAPVLLLESTFAVGEGSSAPITWDSNIEPKLCKYARSQLVDRSSAAIAADKDLDASEKKCLQTIRIRYRIADALDDSATFKLGIPIGIFKVGVELNAVARAGASGIVDLNTHWFGKDSDTLNRKTTYPTTSVPAAILLHQ